MKKSNYPVVILLTLAMTALLALGGCGGQDAAKEAIAPLPSGLDLAAGITDATLAVNFTADDYQSGEEGDQLNVTVYDMDIYDAVEISQLQVGDSIVIDGQTVTIETLTESDNGLEINGGEGESANGATLVSSDGGTYRVQGMDDYATYTELGQASFPLSPDCVLIDGSQAVPGTDTEPVTVSFDGIKDYLANPNDYASYNQFNTTVLVEGGVITEINRVYVP